MKRRRESKGETGRKGVAMARLKAKMEALERGERAAERVFRFEALPAGGLRREMLDPEAYRRKIARE